VTRELAVPLLVTRERLLGVRTWIRGGGGRTRVQGRMSLLIVGHVWATPVSRLGHVWVTGGATEQRRVGAVLTRVRTHARAHADEGRRHAREVEKMVAAGGRESLTCGRGS
jgi:hypothetical protein